MHESVSVHDLRTCTRPWFEWANAMLVVFVENALGLDCSAAAETHRLTNIQVNGWTCSALQGQTLRIWHTGQSCGAFKWVTHCMGFS
jgi:hypothetical protein